MKSTGTQPDLPIIFEDEYLIIVNKPADVLSQADKTGDADVTALCKQYLRLKSDAKDSSYVGLLHRLDRPVSGLMMLAKTHQTAKRLSQQMRDRRIQKTYLAIVQGHPPANGILIHHLVKDNHHNMVQTVPANHPAGKQGVLSFLKQGESAHLSLIAVHLQTGRPHQIRVQLATEGYPIWGDYKYGRDQPDGRTMALQAHKLVFEHPASGEEIQVSASHPDKDIWKLFNNR